MNVGFCAVVLDSVTLSGPVISGSPFPSTCVHAYVIAWFSGSDEPEPSSVTVWPALIPLWSGPAFAVGTPFASTEMSTMSGVLTRVELVGDDELEVQRHRAGAGRGERRLLRGAGSTASPCRGR